ncbi:MAG: MFS transporter [Chloroflexi bacterium]|nr:MFS transporter [Chloroflexota bacterium]
MGEAMAVDRGSDPERTGAAPASTLPPAPRGLSAFRHTFRALSYRGYRLLWLAQMVAFLGNQMNFVTRGWLAFQLTGSATAIGQVTLGWAGPMLFLSLVGGVVADRYDRRRLLMAVQAGQGVMGLAVGLLIVLGALEVWHLFLAAFWQGTMFSVLGPARQALIPQLVDERDLGNAVALNNTAMNLTFIIGPSVAGIVLATAGAAWVYALMTLCFAGVVALLAAIRPADTRPAERRPRTGMLDEMRGGLRYVFVENRLVATLIITAAVPIVLGFPYQLLLPVFQETVFRVDPKGLGLMYTTAGIGALLGSLLVANYADHEDAPQFQMLAGAGFGAALAAFAFSPNFWLANAVLVVVGLCSMAFFSFNTTAVLSSTRPAFHGRVMSIFMLTFSLLPIGVLPLSLLTDVYGARPTIGACGIVLGLFVLAMSRLSRSA